MLIHFQAFVTDTFAYQQFLKTNKSLFYQFTGPPKTNIPMFQVIDTCMNGECDKCRRVNKLIAHVKNKLNQLLTMWSILNISFALNFSHAWQCQINIWAWNLWWVFHNDEMMIHLIPLLLLPWAESLRWTWSMFIQDPHMPSGLSNQFITSCTVLAFKNEALHQELGYKLILQILCEVVSAMHSFFHHFPTTKLAFDTHLIVVHLFLWSKITSPTVTS